MTPNQTDAQNAYNRQRAAQPICIPEAAMPYLIELEMWKRLYEEAKSA